MTYSLKRCFSRRHRRSPRISARWLTGPGCIANCGVPMSPAQCPEFAGQDGPKPNHPFLLDRGFLKAGYSVDDQALDATPLNGLEQPVGKLIQNMLAHGVPEQFYLA